MKIRPFITYATVLILSLFLFLSCIDNKSVKFEIPQPEEKQNENGIPERLTGKYISVKDSTLLVISNDHVISFHEPAFQTAITLLDSIDQLNFENDTSDIDRIDNLKTNIRIRNDTMIMKFEYSDTIFNIHKNDIVRKFKGYYFLNSRTKSGQWNVTKLGKTPTGVVVGKISSKDDLEMLRELTDTKFDTVYLFKPSKGQFRKFIRGKGFHDEEQFVKIRE